MKICAFPCLLLFIIVNSPKPISAQSPDGGGEYKFLHAECVSAAQRAEIERRIDINRAELMKSGILKTPKKTRATLLQWPLKQASGFDYCSYFGISNFVDHNAAYPNQVLDYNCGSRTYDLASGYNHSGTDIFLWPFEWNMMSDEQVEVIAAAPGVIVDKFDGNFDMNCGFGNFNWNAVYVQHADGSIAWYGHMKNGSLTNKNIGDNVVPGEKLGLVGSSGASTGPHLHFELHDMGGNLIDPYSGPCSVPASWWATAKNYYEPAVNVAMTHSAAPVFNTCPQPATTNVKDTFAAGDVVLFAAYFHDQTAGTPATYTVRRSDNSTFATWTHSSPQSYNASYWYWTYTLPFNALNGIWNMSVSYEGNTCSHDFVVGHVDATGTVEVHKGLPPLKLIPNPAAKKVKIEGAEGEVKLWNLYGQLLETTAASYELSVDKLENGIYIVQAGNRFLRLQIQH